MLAGNRMISPEYITNCTGGIGRICANRARLIAAKNHTCAPLFTKRLLGDSALTEISLVIQP